MRRSRRAQRGSLGEAHRRRVGMRGARRWSFSSASATGCDEFSIGAAPTSSPGRWAADRPATRTRSRSTRRVSSASLSSGSRRPSSRSIRGRRSSSRSGRGASSPSASRRDRSRASSSTRPASLAAVRGAAASLRPSTSATTGFSSRCERAIRSRCVVSTPFGPGSAVTTGTCAPELFCGQADARVLQSAGINAAPKVVTSNVNELTEGVKNGSIDAVLLPRTDLRAVITQHRDSPDPEHLSDRLPDGAVPKWRPRRSVRAVAADGAQPHARPCDSRECSRSTTSR